MPDMSLITQNTGEEVRPLPRVVLCGDARSSEFEVVLGDVQAVVPSESIFCVAGLSELRDWLGLEAPPDLIVFVQTWPDEFQFEQLLTLPGIGPYSRILCCYGPWCASDGRSRQEFPLAARVPLEQLGFALAIELQQSTAPLPWTAGRDEVFGYRYQTAEAKLFALGPKGLDRPQSPAGAEVRVYSHDHELTDLLIAAVHVAGCPTTAEVREGQMVLWDVDVWTDSIAAEWSTLRHQFPHTRIVALTGFADPRSAAAIQSSGAVAVISKLLPMRALVACLNDLSANAA